MTGSNWDFKYFNQSDKAWRPKNASTTSQTENNIKKKTKKKNTDGLSACPEADADCILMADSFEAVLRFTFAPVPQKQKS